MISVKGDDRLKAAVLAMKSADRDLKKDINNATRQVMGPVWVQEVNAHAKTNLDRLIIAKGARIKAGNPPVAVAASSTKKLSNGLTPATTWAPFEFGGYYQRVTRYSRKSPRGKSHKVTRHTSHQLPRRNTAGRVAYQAFAEIAPRAVSLWTQLVVKKYYQSFEGRS